MEEGNKRSRGLEENKERHERNLRFEQSPEYLALVTSNWAPTINRFFDLNFSVLRLLVCKAEMTVEPHLKKKTSAQQLLQPKHMDAAEMSTKKEKKPSTPAI